MKFLWIILGIAAGVYLLFNPSFVYIGVIIVVIITIYKGFKGGGSNSGGNYNGRYGGGYYRRNNYKRRNYKGKRRR